jgi:hypothetical protein
MSCNYLYGINENYYACSEEKKQKNKTNKTEWPKKGHQLCEAEL